MPGALANIFAKLSTTWAKYKQSLNLLSFVSIAILKANVCRMRIIWFKIISYSFTAPISAFIHPQTQIADIGNSVKIECVVSGRPIKILKWMKDGEIIKRITDMQGKSSDVLFINSLNSTSQGMYQCFVENEFEVKQAVGQIILSGTPSMLFMCYQISTGFVYFTDFSF